MKFPNETLFVNFFTGLPIRDVSFGDSVLVGSSGNLLKGKLGKEIDKFETVFRMNNAPTNKLFNKYVGKKTTVRVCAYNAIKGIEHLLYGLKYLIIWGPEQSYKKITPIVSMFRVRHPELKIFRLTDKAIKLNDKEFAKKTGRNRLQSGSWLSTGWFSIFIMINLCSSITICGFGCLRDSKPGISYHYWDNLHGSEVGYLMKQQKATKGHRFLTEMKIFHAWQHEYNIEFT